MKHLYIFFLSVSFSAFSQSVAVTEFIVDPVGVESDDEWIELHNYDSSTSMNLINWSLRDEDGEDVIISSTNVGIAPGEYVILAKNKLAFETNWLNGCANDKVIEVNFSLDNDSDEIILVNDSGNTVWSLAYANDASEGFSTHFTEDTYDTKTFGSKAAPGINRAGNDVTGTLGYEKNNVTSDSYGFMSHTGDMGSPLNKGVDMKQRGNALTLDGVDDYINLGPMTSIEAMTQFTFEAWVQPLSIATDNERIFSKRLSNNNRIEISLGTLQTLKVFINNGISELVETPNNSVLINQWNHIAVVFDGTQPQSNRLKVYVNGIEQSVTGTISATTTPSGIGSAHIGNRSDNSNKNSNIIIDEIRLWDIARTGEAVRKNMHLTVNDCDNSGLVRYYQLNESSGTVLSDYMNNSDATLIGGNFNNSDVNVGNSASSIHQEISNIATIGVQDFNDALLSINYTAKSEAEDIAVTYSNFTPNTLSGTESDIMVLNEHTWTLNTSSSTGTYVGDFTFILPNNFINLSIDAGNYTLYNRSMQATGSWTPIASASSTTSNTLTFGDISVKGQFLIAQTSDNVLSNAENVWKDNSIALYPNPLNSDILYINYKGTEPINTLIMYDLKGAKVMTHKMEQLNQTYRFKLTKHLDAGVYIVVLKTDTRTLTRKLIIN